MLYDAAFVLGAYLVGSIASAVVVCRALGLPDPRTGGSGNPGATNVLRLGGRGPAAATLAGDVLKGLVPVLVAVSLDRRQPVVAATMVAAFLGHLYPVFFRFRGGKGVATAFGGVAGLAWPVMVAMGVIWIAVATMFRYSSLAALTAAGAAPVLALSLAPHPANAVALGIMALLIVWRHRSNVVRLADGTESRIGRAG